MENTIANKEIISFIIFILITLSTIVYRIYTDFIKNPKEFIIESEKETDEFYNKN